MKVRPAVAELFQTDGRTDMRKSVVAFRNCANAPECNTFWPQVALVFPTDLGADSHFYLENVNSLLFIRGVECVHCAVRPEFFSIIQLNLRL